MKHSDQTTMPALKRSRWFSKGTILTSLAALLAVGASAQVTYTPVFSNVWVVTAGHHWDLTNRADATATTSRGVGISPLTTNVLFSSTYFNTNGGSAHVAALGFSNGSNYLGQLNGTGISSGVALLMNVRVSDDGSVYACNRRDGGASTFTIYRWPSEADTTTAPTKVVDAAFTQRLGDHMDVRGSGTNTEIVVVGSLAGTANAAVSTNFFIFRPTDATLTTFTNFSITIPGFTVSAINSAHGVTFEGTNNAIYVSSGTAVRRVSYDPNTLTATVTRTNATDSGNCRALKYYASTNGVQLLACVAFSSTAGAAQTNRVFQIPASPTAALVSVLSSNFPAPYTGSQNGNGLGQVDAKNGYFIFGAPGYGLSFFKVDFVTTAPPSGLTLTGSGTAFVEGFPATFTATASGSTPLTYQFYFTNATSTNLLVSSTNSVYTNATVAAANIGGYFVVVTNLYGRATSSVASIATVLPNGSSKLMTNLWSLAPGSRSYLTVEVGTENQRGLAFDPINQRLVVISRTPTNGVHLVDAATAADQGELDLSFMFALTPQPGTFKLNVCGVADDGAVYACNLLASDTGSDYFALYRWEGATTTATMTGAYGGNPLPGTGTTGRIGDTMAVRGAGVNTEILCSFRNTNCVALFTTSDGVTFNPTIITITNLPNGGAGLSVAWGVGNTFWGKTDSLNNLRLIAYDPLTGIGAVIGSYPLLNTETVAGIDNANGYAATIGNRVNPQNLAIYDITTPGGPSLNTLLDREFFPVNNGNGNYTGAVAFDVAGGRVFALDSNNGILALSYAGRAAINQAAGETVVSWPTATATLQASTNVAGPYLDVSGATSPYTNTTGSVKFFRLKK